MDALDRIRAQRGLATRIKEEIGLKSRATVSQWKKVPIEHLAAVSRVTGIPERELRPDVWEIVERNQGRG
jgi:hypothetical protein